MGETTGFLVDADALEDICEDVGGLIGLEPEVLSQGCNTGDREVFIAGMYEALVDWVISKANEAIAQDLRAGASTPDSEPHDGDEVSLTVLDIPGEPLAKAVALRNVFDDNDGINAEMKDDGVEVVHSGHSVLREVQTAVSEVEADLGIAGGPMSRERDHDRDRREGILEKIGAEAEAGGFLRTLLYPVDGEGLNFGRRGRFDLATTLASSRAWYQLSLHPTDDSPSAIATLASPTSAWSAGTVSRQLRSWRLPEWANRRNKHIDFTADFDVEEFVTRYSRLGCQEGKDGIETFLLERGWTNGEVIIGKERIWMRESAWWEAESMLDLKPEHELAQPTNPFETGYSSIPPNNGSGFFAPMDTTSVQDSRENLMGNATKSGPPTMARTVMTVGGDYGLGPKGDDRKDQILYYDPDLGRYVGELDPEFGDPRDVQTKSTTFGRQVWVSFVWAMTWFIPSVGLRYLGRMKRPDVRFAWREKVVLMLLIFLLNACIIFYIIFFGKLLCPNFDKAWNEKELGYHQGTNDFYVGIHGKVYDITKFYKIQHSDTDYHTTEANMMPFAGKILDVYFPPPLNRACPGLDIDASVRMESNDSSILENPAAVHTSGPRYQTDPQSKLASLSWYQDKFLPKIEEYYKGDLVWSKKQLKKQADIENRQWFVINSKIYDLTDYFYTLGSHGQLQHLQVLS